MRTLAPTALLLALALAGCGGDEEVVPTAPPPTEETVPTETEPPTTTETVDEDLGRRCENEAAGFAVSYPDDWHTNAGEIAPACSFFNPEPFEVPEATEAVGVAAIHIFRDPVGFEEVLEAGLGIEVLEEEELEIDGRPAVRREVEATGEGLLEAGTRSVEYVVDVGGGETLFASTFDVHQGDFEQGIEVLDRMMETLELTG